MMCYFIVTNNKKITIKKVIKRMCDKKLKFETTEEIYRRLLKEGVKDHPDYATALMEEDAFYAANPDGEEDWEDE